MGIDLKSCKCESYRNGIALLTNNVEVRKVLKKNIWIKNIHHNDHFFNLACYFAF